MRVLRGHIVCHELCWRVPAETFRQQNYGWARTEIVNGLLKELGIEVTDFGSAQMMPIKLDYQIVLREQ